jgi:hypothetical protein
MTPATHGCHRANTNVLFDGVRGASDFGAAMTSWFVSTTRPLSGSQDDVEWILTARATEEEAKQHASKALVRGFRIEAGTVPGVEPPVRIAWPAAHHWAQSSNGEAIMSLRNRLAAFCGPTLDGYKTGIRA